MNDGLRRSQESIFCGCAIHCNRHDTLSEREERMSCTYD